MDACVVLTAAYPMFVPKLLVQVHSPLCPSTSSRASPADRLPCVPELRRRSGCTQHTGAEQHVSFVTTLTYSVHLFHSRTPPHDPDTKSHHRQSFEHSYPDLLSVLALHHIRL
jgi:hypothetical protein